MTRLRLRRDRVVFTDVVPERNRHLHQHADVYISLSEHEGFCVPLVEAMAADVPVLAYAKAAVPETLGGAGVLFAEKNLELEAELLDELAFNDALRDQIIEGQRRRLQDFSEARLSRELGALIGSLS
jgi:glycosyltransferase involved in cell wall biosynthesis